MPSHIRGIMWSVGGAERCCESEAFSLFASYRAVASAAYAGLENRQDMARYGILGQKGFKSSDQRINHVDMGQERSNAERMRGFGAE